MEQLSRYSLDSLCAALCYALGVEPPAHAASANPYLTGLVDRAFSGQGADRVFMYNPDAIAQWIWEKYPQLLKSATASTEPAGPSPRKFTVMESSLLPIIAPIIDVTVSSLPKVSVAVGVVPNLSIASCTIAFEFIT